MEATHRDAAAQISAQTARTATAPVHPVAPGTDGRRKGRKAYVILGTVALVVICGILLHAALTRGQEWTDNAQVDADVVPLGARVGGPVRRVLVHEDQLVKKGDLLFELDDGDYAAKERQAEAELQTAQAQAQAADEQAKVVEASARGGFSSARAQVSGSSLAVSGAEAQIAAAKAGLLRAQAEARRTELDLKRTKDLFAASAVPQERLDNAQAASDTAQAQLEQARAQLAAAEEGKRLALTKVEEARGHLDQSAPISSQISVAQANANLAHGKVKGAEAALELARLQHAYTQVRAPADGFISRLGAREGQLVQPGQALAELVPSDTYVVANFKETQVGRMRAGDRAEIELDGFPGRTFEGKVVSLSGGTGSRFSLLPPDNASGNFVKVVQRVPVRIAWTRPPDVPMRAGLSAEVRVYESR